MAASRPPSPTNGLAVSAIVDHAIVDGAGHRAGRVDDLAFDVREGDGREAPVLILRELASGPLPRQAPRWMAAAIRLWYRAIGLADPHPARIDWSHVERIDAMVHIDVDRDTAGLRAVDQALERWIQKLPRARVKP